MPIPPVALQLYTVRDALRADYDGTLERIAAIGYDLVEPFDLLGQADRLRTGLSAHGLAARSTHLNFLDNPTDPAAAFATAAELGIPTVIEPYADPRRWTSVDGIRRAADGLNAAATIAAAHGIRIGYHNHAFEFTGGAVPGDSSGMSALDVLADALDPAIVLEIDVYWAAVGGQDVIELLRRLGDRVRFLHVQDGPVDPDAPQTAVGSGRMPILGILDAAPAVEVGVVELSEYDGDMWDAVEDSLRFLADLRVSP